MIRSARRGGYTDWWDLDGDVTDCIHAYQPVGASTYTTSKYDLHASSNLSNDSTYPSWTSGNGWYFSISALLASFTLPKPFTMIAAINLEYETNDYTIVGCQGGNSGIQWRVENASGDHQQLLKAQITSVGWGSTKLYDDTNYVLAVSYSATGSYAFYIDGGADNSGTNNQTLTSRNLRIGMNWDINGPFMGYIKGIAFYDAVLSSTDIGLISAALALKVF